MTGPKSRSCHAISDVFAADIQKKLFFLHRVQSVARRASQYLPPQRRHVLELRWQPRYPGLRSLFCDY